MSNGFLAVDANKLPWEEGLIESIGRKIYRKNLFSDPETGMMVRLG